VEHVGLAHHGPHAAHLEHEPLQHPRARAALGRQQPPGLVRQIDQDGAGLEHREIVLVAVHDDRNAAIGVEGEEVRLLLFALAQVDGVHRVGSPISSRAMDTFQPLGVDAV